MPERSRQGGLGWRGSDVRAIARSRERARTPGRYIDVDASYKDGLAGIAYVGLAGDHERSITAASSTHGELCALLVAMAAAENQAITDVTFRTDCKVVADGGARGLGTLVVAAFLERNASWRVVFMPRARNGHANTLARWALKQALDCRDSALVAA